MMHRAVFQRLSPDGYPRPVAAAVERLLHSGISGPYALALGGEQYQRVVQTAEHGGYPLLEHLRKILEGGPIVWAPGVRGAVVVSLRGGDFLLESGQDLSIGYDSHDAEAVRLYIEESFSFRVATPEAAVALSGRPFLNYDVPLALDRLGALETELVPHFFRSVVDHGKFNLHLLRWAGTNNHHLCEAAFKAFARAFRQAKAVDGDVIPSTKGSL